MYIYISFGMIVKICSRWTKVIDILKKKPHKIIE